MRDGKKRNAKRVVVSKRWIYNKAGVKAVRKEDRCGLNQRKELPRTQVHYCAAVKVKLDKSSMR